MFLSHLYHHFKSISTFFGTDMNMTALAKYEAYAQQKMASDLGINIGPTVLGYALAPSQLDA